MTNDDSFELSNAASAISRLIHEMSKDRATASEDRTALRELTAEVREDRIAIQELSGTLTDLTVEIQNERRERIEADSKLNERIARIAREQGREQIRKTLQVVIPAAAMLGGAFGWFLERGPSVISAWQMLP